MKDFSLNEKDFFVSSERDLIIQQIDMIFDTLPSEVYGEYNYGSDFWQFLWDMNVSNSEISEYAREKILNNVNLFGWDCQVETTLLHGTKNDIILLTVKLFNKYENFEKTYRVD